ncbi:S8 family serine peptidase [Halorubellus litoreus]|uniref:S8 family serine peptidase n=1 Tax=Halorubellus litoreus TaxID=755308 RepID=A0ABD5V9Q8_9EURY
MTSNRTRFLSVLFVCIMSLSMVAPVVSAGSATVATDAANPELGTVDTAEPVDKIHPSLQDAEGTKQVIVRLDDAEVAASQSGTEVVSTLKRQAASTQDSLVQFAAQREGVTVENTFWITNAVLLEVDTDSVALGEIARMSGVSELHANFEVQRPDPRRGASTASASTTNDYNTTYGLDHVNATEVWDAYDTQGEGVKVAVLDTGVDASHQDIDLYTENASDPTYPGGWAEFNGSGAVIPGSEPYDSNGHGTHTSGTVAGGDASGEHIGVAPGATLIHGGVLTENGGTFAAILGGMQWAVEEDADVMSMSLGCIVGETACYTEATIEPIQNAEAAGTIVIASAGNDGQGFSSSPGNVYDAVSIGASDVNYDIASFSSGMVVNTTEAWGSAAPEHWPSEYVVPDVSAPGVAVKSSVPGDSYSEYSGTSMAAPHVAGIVALMESVAGEDELSNDEIRTALRESAWKPADAPDQKDVRYGEGIVDAKAAVDFAVLEQGVEGTVTGPNGTPIEGATVSLSGAGSATTNASGAYSIVAQNGTYDLTVNAFGYESTTTTVTVDGDYVTKDVSLSPTLDVSLVDGQRTIAEGGENVTVTVDAANLQTYTAELADGYSTDDATLYLEGTQIQWGEELDFGEPTSGTATLTIQTAPGTSGNVSVVHTFGGLGESVQVTTGPTAVFEEVTEVGVVEDAGSQGEAVQSTLDEMLPASYRTTVLDSETATQYADAFDAFVVQNLASGNADAFTAATANDSTGVVYLDNWGGEANGIPARSSALGDPANTDFAYGDGNVSYAVTETHPILAGVATPGENVQVHTATGFNDHSWFNGTDATVLADLETADAGVKGVGLAVDESRRDVLASTLGRETYVEDPQFTQAADQILANAVQWAAGEGVDSSAGTLDVNEQVVDPGTDATVTVNASGVEDVAGYQAKLTFDPQKLEVANVSGVDFADPVVRVDNEDGVVYMAQAQASGVNSPSLVEVEFDVLMDDYNESATVEWAVEESLVSDSGGNAPSVDFSNGGVETPPCAPGDVNQDGSVTVQDATLVQQYIVGQEPANFVPSCADMNGDGDVTSADVTLILEEIVGEDDDSGTPSVVAVSDVASPMPFVAA